MTKKPFTNIDGLVVRPSRETDSTFLQTLYHSARPDLQLIDGERDQVEDVIAQQFRVQDLGLGEHFPNAMHYVVEKLGTPIGALVTDFGHNEIRVLYLAFIPAARGKGYGRNVVQGVQQAAEQIRCPVATVVWANNPHARQHYLALGFEVQERDVAAERLIWYPGQAAAG
ncbi:GNAT family N-acetyltransferase [Pseudomonas syringae pv. actinidiae]|uniref:GCN5-like N-acetyltransferase n=6 Tax=Pseudomonas syringae group TaxID=136849 RepID=A0A656K3V6_PSESF|nr:GNAT family N-acetyltransferase [Pseudomonas syringae]EPN66128.1 GCN5-like N-acetyltransferase [Pseudomonas syringae pv. actinidiae ICMP 19101]EPN68779.1 GCN5-like N-acetyltransferase [Pseudomonas syringae pv. actinidiae ICMP 19096]EPN71247.1 GCN5-like N-acetyltransferase [Pseudomonas syringae pv. actinidiae ICMP 19079]OZI85239.1 N-acetyltransferase [Pseudomonas avellanae]AKT29119.1 acetyltransferase [Pseudomonas syringae pv. actinidiae ICMP 18884]